MAEDGGFCVTCGQTYPDGMEEALRTDCAVTEQKAKQLHDSVDKAMLMQRDVVQELQEELDVLQRKRVSVIQQQERNTAARAAVDTWDKNKKHHDLKLSQGKLCAKALGKDIQRAEGELKRMVVDYDTLKACEKVVGLNGPRAHVLGTALGGLETVANGWLDRLMYPGLRLRLNPYSTTQKGDVKDAIGLDVEGAGGGHGYRAASGGERRRIDVALVLALAEVAGAAHGRSTGTLWFDEVFDALDADGRDAVATVIAELARERCVVVITHDAGLAQQLRPVQHLHVKDGAIAA